MWCQKGKQTNHDVVSDGVREGEVVVTLCGHGDVFGQGAVEVPVEEVADGVHVLVCHILESLEKVKLDGLLALAQGDSLLIGAADAEGAAAGTHEADRWRGLAAGVGAGSRMGTRPRARLHLLVHGCCLLLFRVRRGGSE